MELVRDYGPVDVIWLDGGQVQRKTGLDIGIEDISLQKLFANLFGQKISKRQQLSNWEAYILNEKQKLYAATDAWACLKMYKELIRLKETNDYELITQEEV